MLSLARRAILWKMLSKVTTTLRLTRSSTAGKQSRQATVLLTLKIKMMASLLKPFLMRCLPAMCLQVAEDVRLRNSGRRGAALVLEAGAREAAEAAPTNRPAAPTKRPEAARSSPAGAGNDAPRRRVFPASAEKA